MTKTEQSEEDFEETKAYKKKVKASFERKLFLKAKEERDEFALEKSPCARAERPFILSRL